MTAETAMEDDGAKKIKGMLIKSMNIPLKIMPLWMEAIGAGVIISTMTDKNPRFKERLREIDGKVFLFEAKDIKKRFYLHIRDGGIKVAPHFAGTPDVVMTGNVKTLADVLLGREDPDTVFFSRRLEISGDTAVAIHFKNILAALQ
ncbi:MAG: SCP2 sterol-binding domain-containing protein [Deltaproteobacteria bacterium]